jgi:hypothetical protein
VAQQSHFRYVAQLNSACFAAARLADRVEMRWIADRNSGLPEFRIVKYHKSIDPTRGAKSRNDGVGKPTGPQESRMKQQAS